jgi:predicted transcriptional regulator
MSESTFTIRVDDRLKEAFTEAAKVNDRTGAQIIRDFMREYVQSAREKAEYEEWFKASVEAGLRDIEEGRVLSCEEVKARSLARREHLLTESRKRA